MVADTAPAGRDSANRELKSRLKAALDRQGLSQAAIVRQTQQRKGESVGKATVSNALNPDMGPPAAFTLNAILNAAGIRGTERDELSRLRAQAARGTTQLDRYLAAAKKAADHHPYLSLEDDEHPPRTDVYVRKQRNQASGSQVGPSLSGVSAGSEPGPAIPAREVFLDDSGICVLLAGAGGGKSTLLRTHVINSADCLPDNGAEKAVPAMVSASALISEDTLPRALAAASTRALKDFGLLDDLTADFFRRQPRPGTLWLVLVDGLDEIPETGARSAVLRMLANAAAAEPTLYRFVVATRPLPGTELDTLALHVPRYELQPFSPNALLGYAKKRFRNLDDAPDRHAKAFMAGLERSRLDVLACIPLMASMLCQLYAADHTRPLPDGRAGVYKSFVELIWAENTDKDIRNSHAKAIRELKDRYQIPRDNQAAEQAAQQVRDHLPELIDHLAYERVNGNAAPAVEVLASHLHATRPCKVKEQLWNSFIGDLLRPTGLLTQSADDFDFLHQTLLEYHAARHATRDQRARAQLLRVTFQNTSTDDRWQPPALDPSYLGFLLDGLLAPDDRIAAETRQYLEDLTAHGGRQACWFLTTQARLRTKLLPGPTATQLARFANDTTLDGVSRVRAAASLAKVDGYRDLGIAWLTHFAGDATLDGFYFCRMLAAWALATTSGCQESGAAWLAYLAGDTTLNGLFRVQAAEALAKVDGYQESGAAWLTHLAGDTTLNGLFRVQAAEALTEVDGRRDDGVAWLTHFAWNAILDGDFRRQAAVALVEVDGRRDDGVAWLTHLAGDTTLDGSFRVRSAAALVEVDGHRDLGVAWLTHLAGDTTLNGPFRVQAAEALTEGNEHRDALLAHLAENAALADRPQAALDCVQVSRDLAEGMDDCTARFTRLMEDTTLDDGGRILALQDIAQDLQRALIAGLTFMEHTILDNGDGAQAAPDPAHMDDVAARVTRLAQAFRDQSTHGDEHEAGGGSDH